MRINHLLKNVGERLKCMYVMPDAVETTAYWDTGARQEQNRKEKKKKNAQNFYSIFGTIKWACIQRALVFFSGKKRKGDVSATASGRWQTWGGNTGLVEPSQGTERNSAF